jgi:uncharacterized small protein (DUF1192 family)
MASFGKRILSAFVEVKDKEPTVPAKPAASQHQATPAEERYKPPLQNSDKFKQYFEKLFRDANIPGPDYFEFSKMIEAMNSIADEKSSYSAAYAGLNVQGLDKVKLLSTAADYLQVLKTDAANFDSTVDAALREKVHDKQEEIKEKSKRIALLSQEIEDLHAQVKMLDAEIKDNEEKIESNSGAYKNEMGIMTGRILQDIEKIKLHIP